MAQQWWTRNLKDTIELPGVLTAQGYGDPVSMQTQWTGNVREEWVEDPRFESTPGSHAAIGPSEVTPAAFRLFRARVQSWTMIARFVAFSFHRRRENFH